MKKLLLIVLASFLPAWSASSMSNPPKVLPPAKRAPVTQPASTRVGEAGPIDDSTTAVMKYAIQQICAGPFNNAAKLLHDTAPAHPKIAALKSIISQYKQIE